MALMDHKTARLEVPLSEDNSFSVRGLDIDDITHILTNYLPAVTKAAELWKQHQESTFTNVNFVNMCGVLSTEFPGLVMEVISIAADEPEAKNVRIGLGAQIAALQAIFKLTVEDAGNVGNLFATVAAAAKGALSSARDQQQQRSRSRNSIGA